MRGLNPLNQHTPQIKLVPESSFLFKLLQVRLGLNPLFPLNPQTAPVSAVSYLTFHSCGERVFYTRVHKPSFAFCSLYVSRKIINSRPTLPSTCNATNICKGTRVRIKRIMRNKYSCKGLPLRIKRIMRIISVMKGTQ